MPKYPDYMRYVKRVRSVLLAAGEDGIKQRDLYYKVRTPSWGIDNLRDLLATWETAGWVQSFIIRPVGSKRNAQLWRATTLLRDKFVMETKPDG
jgi:hypothetical protein